MIEKTAHRPGPASAARAGSAGSTALDPLTSHGAARGNEGIPPDAFFFAPGTLSRADFFRYFLHPGPPSHPLGCDCGSANKHGGN